MAKKKNPYFVVWKGAKTGVLESWQECKKSVYGFKGAQYKSFPTLESAQEAFSKSYNQYKGKKAVKTSLSKERLAFMGSPNLNSVSVDAACSGNPGVVEYQCVDTKTKKRLFHLGPLYESTNNIGEFLGLVHTLAYLNKTNDKRPIYTDSNTAISWVKKKMYKTSLKRTQQNVKSFELMDRAVQWLQSHPIENKILKWETQAWGEIPADFGRK